MPDLALYRKVADAVRAKGTATTQDLAQMCPGVSAERLCKALSNAKAKGWVQIVRKRTCGPNGLPTVWATVVPGIVPSVWDLASPKAFEAQPMPGRRYMPLGDWPEYQPRSEA